MRKLSLFLLSFFYIASFIHADNLPIYYPGDSNSTLYTSDGLHSLTVTCENSLCSYSYDGVKKGSYPAIDYPLLYGNDFYFTATETNGNRILIKNTSILGKGEIVNILTYYNPISTLSEVVGWYTIQDGKYRLYKTDGSLMLSVDNVGSSSSAFTTAGSSVVQSSLYDKNNVVQTVYLNAVKVSSGNGYVNVYGTLSVKKNSNLLLVSSSLPNGTINLFTFDVNNGAMKSLPSYQGVTQVATIFKKDNTIKDFQYVAQKDDGFVFVNKSGKILSKEPVDSVSILTNYGDSYFKTFTKDEKSFLYFGDKLYGPFDYIDSFNPSYGQSGNYSKVLRWSVFVKKDGKNLILVNGKLYPAD